MTDGSDIFYFRKTTSQGGGVKEIIVWVRDDDDKDSFYILN